MTSHQFIVIMRWLLVPVAAALGIITALLPSIIVNRIIHAVLWSSGHHMHGKVFMSHYSIPVCGAFAALFFVLFGTWAAPRHRFIVALVLLVIGGVLAWMCVGNFFSPVSSQRIWEPIIGTYSGGFIAFIIVYFRTGLRRVFCFNRSRS